MFATALVVTALIAVTTTVIMVVAGGGGDGSQWLATVGFLAWSLSPYALLVLLAWIVRARRAASIVLLVGLVALGAWGSWSYYDGVIAHPDPQAGLYFVLIPLLQWGGAVILGMAILLTVLVERRARRGRA